MLGVRPDVTPEELKHAYRRLARRYHPDKNPQGQALFTEIADAYGLLSDPERRSRYDRERAGRAPEAAPPEPMSRAGASAAGSGEPGRAERHRVRPETPEDRLERLYGPRPTAWTAVKLAFYLPAGAFAAVLVSAFATVSQGDAARDVGRWAALLLWLALWSFLAAAKLKLWMLHRRAARSGRF
ncbi:hypothetical protein Psi01_17680 [Planobispora siamensis]|uniref:J domain-containing protein n=1 Tax=Planobispora siamensis TaxID=936338 RepID=A0A8J3SK70_9ACTN|nr:hypothetical protein Psi01_17680 [Planobispora siamensis]